MASIIYTASDNELEHRLMALLEKMIPGKKFEISHTIEELSERLRKPRSNIRVVVLFAVRDIEITQLVSMGDLIVDKKSLLVLTDDDRETIKRAHMLRPRHMTWVDTDFKHIAEVLKNMVDLYDAPPGRKEGGRLLKGTH